MRFTRKSAVLALLGVGLPVAAALASAARGERIIDYDALERDDVPHYRAHVLDAAKLTPLSEEDTDLNVTVYPLQAPPGGDAFVFSGSRARKEAHYQVTEQNRLVRQSLAPAAQAQPEYGIEQVDPRGSDWVIKRGAETILKFAWSIREESSSAPPQILVPFNGGKSLLLKDSRILVIPDLSAPKLVHVPVGMFYGSSVVSEGKTLVGLESLSDRRTNTEIFWNQCLARISASGNVTRSEPIERKAGDMFQQVVPLPEQGLILALADTTLVAFDHDTLKQRWSLPVQGGRRLRGLVERPGGKHWALVGKDLIELESQKTVAHVEELFPVSAALLTPDALYWAGAGDPKAFMHMTTLHRLDLNTLKESGAYTLTPGRYTKDDLSTIRNIHALPGNRLLVLTGSQVVFMDHAHMR